MLRMRGTNWPIPEFAREWIEGKPGEDAWQPQAPPPPLAVPATAAKYVCDGCGQTFNRKFNLDRHKQRKHVGGNAIGANGKLRRNKGRKALDNAKKKHDKKSGRKLTLMSAD